MYVCDPIIFFVTLIRTNVSFKYHEIQVVTMKLTNVS
jgi:hypothetical protein